MTQPKNSSRRNSANCVTAFQAQLAAMDAFDAASIIAAIKVVQKETGVKGKNLWMPIRIAVTGITHGPELG